MGREEADDDLQVDASEVWGRLSEERRERALDLLTRIAYQHVKAKAESIANEGEGGDSDGDE